MSKASDTFSERIEQYAGNVYAPECPSRALLDHVTSRWGVLVLVLLLKQSYRFGELASGIPGVSDKMLSQTLKLLVADGFVLRSVSESPPVRVSYQLTEIGEEVAERIAALVELLETSALAASSQLVASRT